jgi:hypothetical protein
MKKSLIILFLSIAYLQTAIAQHEHHSTKPATPPAKTTPAKKTTKTTKKPAPQPKKARTTTPAKKAPAKATVPASTSPAHDHTQHNTATGSHSADSLQHNMHDTPAPGHSLENMNHDGHSMNDHTAMDMSGAHEHGTMPMSHAFSLNLPMSRNGSGTAWLPDHSFMYGYMLHASDWMFMFHGNVFLRYNNQDFTGKGSRGGAKVDAPNMLMAMGQRRIGKNGLFHFNTMFSLDAPIAGGSGYPLLFQTGETWKGSPLIDRQHPHDLFSELSVSYAHAFTKDIDAFAYLGYPGEPALGPVTFMHRPSGMFNPDAPLSHHWVDATHVTFGVATLGLRYGRFKLEGSSFTGREPDENRYNFEKPRFDSRSVRLSFNPDAFWALQVSHGYLKTPEASHPDEDIYRTTASATHSRPFGRGGSLDVTGLWAVNKAPGEHGSNAALLEASLRLKKLVLYSRYEWVQKSGEELVLDEDIYDHHEMYPVNAITVGAGYDLLSVFNTRLALGGQLSMYHADSRLDMLYGKNPLAGEIYLHLYPGRMNSK